MTTAPNLVLRPVPFRRAVSVGILWALALLLGYILVVYPPADPGWMVFLGLMVAGSAALALAMQRGSASGLELRADGLYTEAGQKLCALEDLRSISRGAFAFKPSNGFLLRTLTPGPRAWRPGLYWRLGTFIGVGGVTSKAQADVMAETIAAILARRDDA